MSSSNLKLMDKFDVVLNYSQDEFLNYLSDFGKCYHYSEQCCKGDFKDRIYIGRITEVYRLIRRGKTGNRPYDTLTVVSRCLLDDVKFRVIFFGNVVSSLLQANVKTSDVIAVKNPNFSKSFGILSLRVGPGSTAMWICKDMQIKSASEVSNNNPQECSNADGDQPTHSADSTSVASLSIHKNHEVYRSQAVSHQELYSGSKEGERRNMIRTSTPFLPIDKPQKNIEQNVCREQEFITPRDTMASQNTAVAGSSRQNTNLQHFVNPITVKTFKKSTALNRTRDTHQTGCTKDSNYRCCCQTRALSCQCHHEIRCSHHSCSSYRGDCYRNSCHCQAFYRHCCLPPRPSHSCSHGRRDCSSRTAPPISCHCRTHSYPCRTSKPNCTSNCCRALDKSCCCRYDNRAPSCCSDLHHIPSEYNSHCNNMSPHAHQQRQDECALKSLEQLLEQQSNNMNDKERLGCLAAGSCRDSAKRTEEWVETWTPSLPSPPRSPAFSVNSRLHKPSTSRPVVRHKTLTTRANRLYTSESTSSSSESEHPESKGGNTTKVIPIIPTKKSNDKAVKPLATRSSQSAVEGSEQSKHLSNDFPYPLSKAATGNQKKKRKLFSVKYNTSIETQKSFVDTPSIVEESTPFSSEQTAFSDNTNSKSHPCSSGVLGERGISEPSKNLGESTGQNVASVDSGTSSGICVTLNEISSNKDKSLSKEDGGGTSGDVGQGRDLENAMDIDSTLPHIASSLPLPESNRNRVYLNKTIHNETSFLAETSQSPKASEETFPELIIDSISAASMSHSRQDIDPRIEPMNNEKTKLGEKSENRLHITSKDDKTLENCHPNAKNLDETRSNDIHDSDGQSSSNYDKNSEKISCNNDKSEGKRCANEKTMAETVSSNDNNENVQNCSNDEAIGEESFPNNESEGKSSPNDNKIDGKMTSVEKRLEGKSDDNPSSSESKNEEKNGQKSLSLSDYNKIKSSITNKMEELSELESRANAAFSGNEKILSEGTNGEGLDDGLEQMELVCTPKKKRTRKRRHREGSGSGSESLKSNETIDLTSPRSSPTNLKQRDSSPLSSSCSFFDAQSHCSPNSNTSSEKWSIKPLHQLNLSPALNETFIKFLSRSSNPRESQYLIELNKTFKVTGIIIDTVPKITESPLSIVKGFCNEQCRTAYQYAEYRSMEEIVVTCNFCSYRSHWHCPNCLKDVSIIDLRDP